MNTREIEKLRKHFIAVAMISVIIVLVTLESVVSIGTMYSTRSLINDTLDSIIKSQGQQQTRREDDAARNPSFFNSFQITFNSRFFFLAVYDKKGNVIKYRSAARSENADLYLGYTDEIRKNAEDSKLGRYGKYYYKSKKISNGRTVVVILDCSAEIDTLTRMIYIVIGISVVGLIAIFFLVRAFSSFVVGPTIENNRRQKQFITNASHELKTPLAVIRANTELEQMMNGENEWNDSTIEQVDRMSGLIQNLVMITRAEEQEERGSLEPVDASKTVSETVEPYKSLALQQNKTLKEEITDGIKFSVDGSKLRQLTTILIDNALKYCDPEGTILVRLKRVKKDRGLVLTVSNDYAEGENVDYSRFFERFYREDQAHNIDKGGYGIGLSIADSICTQYGGSIRADWKDGRISFICELK
ncbi:MAG: sensor histidine kinase [Anaerovoracaceae bacterium]|jgi:two-component system sensor histidine kinase CiaH